MLYLNKILDYIIANCIKAKDISAVFADYYIAENTAAYAQIYQRTQKVTVGKLIGKLLINRLYKYTFYGIIAVVRYSRSIPEASHKAFRPFIASPKSDRNRKAFLTKLGGILHSEKIGIDKTACPI